MTNSHKPNGVLYADTAAPLQSAVLLLLYPNNAHLGITFANQRSCFVLCANSQIFPGNAIVWPIVPPVKCAFVLVLSPKNTASSLTVKDSN